MSYNNRLLLEDCLDDTPQTRAMIDLFEKDAIMLKKFTKALSSSCIKVANAQSTTISACQELSYYLRLYGQQKFPLDSNSNINIQDNQSDKNSVASTLNKFAYYIDEISTCLQVFSTQINDTVIYQLNKIIDDEFDNLNSLSTQYQITSNEEDMARQRILRLPFKKENDQQRLRLSEEYSQFKRKFHQTSMNYYSTLNGLQIKRKYMLIEPMMALMQSMKFLFKMGGDIYLKNESESDSIEKFLNETCNKVCNAKQELADETSKTNQLIDLLKQDESIYDFEKLDINSKTPIDIDANTQQKAGYLNLRSKFPFISKWDRAYYFIQNGCLMHQQKNEIAGSVYMELKSDFSVSACEIDERPYAFQISSQFPKKVTHFQANSHSDREEWILSLQNAINDDNRVKLQSYMSQNAPRKTPPLPSEGQSSSTKNEVKFELNELVTSESINLNEERSQKTFDSFKVRFLGSMNVKYDKKDKSEYINDTIRNVMGARAQNNLFKLNEFNLVIKSNAILLTKPSSLNGDDSAAKFNVIEDETVKARFKLNDLAVWSPHKDNQRLFGFISKDSNQSLKFTCYVFESDIDSNSICLAITKVNEFAYQMNSEYYRKIKETEKEILLQNIRSLPDKKMNDGDQSSNNDNDEDHKDLLNAVSIVMNSQNPNFIALDKEILESYNLNNSNQSESVLVDKLTDQPEKIEVNKEKESDA